MKWSRICSRACLSAPSFQNSGGVHAGPVRVSAQQGQIFDVYCQPRSHPRYHTLSPARRAEVYRAAVRFGACSSVLIDRCYFRIQHALRSVQSQGSTPHAVREWLPEAGRCFLAQVERMRIGWEAVYQQFSVLDDDPAGHVLHALRSSWNGVGKYGAVLGQFTHELEDIAAHAVTAPHDANSVRWLSPFFHRPHISDARLQQVEALLSPTRYELAAAIVRALHDSILHVYIGAAQVSVTFAPRPGVVEIGAHVQLRVGAPGGTHWASVLCFLGWHTTRADEPACANAWQLHMPTV